MDVINAPRGHYYQNITLFAEVPVEHPDLPGVGHVGGNINFLASTVVGDEDMREDAQYAGCYSRSAFIESPTLG